LTVHVWNNSAFVPLKETTSSLTVNNADLRIVNVLPADFNHDGRLDIVLMGIDPKKSDDIHLSLFNGNAKDAFVKPAISYPPAKGSQPFLLDLNGNMKPILLGATQSNPFTQWLFDGKNNL
jgi:integrin alpha FG-GAP repeat containing protein 1